MSRRTAGDGSLFQRKDGTWVGSVEIPSFDGKRRQRRVYSRSKYQCAQKLRELRAKVDTSTLPVTGTTTVARWLESWLTTTQRLRTRPQTYRWYVDAVTNYIVPHIGAQRLDRLTPEHVRVMLAAIPTPRGRQRAYGALNMALTAAMREGLVMHNVAAVVPRPRHRPQPRTALSLESARRLIAAAIEYDDLHATTMATRWLAALLTGARKGELLGLEWSRVNLGKKPTESLPPQSIDLSWQLQQLTKAHGCDPENPCGRTKSSWCPDAHFDFQVDFEYRECHRSLAWTRPKTSAGVRIVPLASPLLEMLGLQFTSDTGANPYDLVWHHGDGRPISPRDDQTIWTDLLKYAGMPHIPIHSLRHTAATLMQKNHVPADVRMQIMGQSSYAAQQAYIHVDTTQERAALKQLGRRLSI